MNTTKNQYKAKMNAYQEKYADIFLNGIQSKASYIELLRDDDIHIAIRPYAERFNDTTISFAVKLRVAHNEFLEPDFTATDESLGALMNYTDLPPQFWASADGRRLSTMFGVAYNAGEGQGEDFIKNIPAKELAKQVYEQLQAVTGKTFKNKVKVLSALTQFYDIQFLTLFKDTIVEIGEAESAGHNVVSLALVKAAKEAEAESEG